MTDHTPLRFGLIGCVKFAAKVTRAINVSPNSTLYAIGDPSIETAKEFLTSNGLSDPSVKIYGSYSEVLDDPDVDAVYVAVGVSVRAEWAVSVARKKKHLLLEKPTGVGLVELDRVLDACESNGVVFMDGTIWLHHPRTVHIKEMLESKMLGDTIDYIRSTMTTSVRQESLDKLSDQALGPYGALGELGCYPIGAVLWVKKNQLPASVIALPHHVSKNALGLITSCTASLHYAEPHKTTATIHCSFRSHLSMDLAVTGSNGSLHLEDFVIPFQEDAACFDYSLGAKFVDLHIGWNVKPEKVVVVTCEFPQEVLMVREFVDCVRRHGLCRMDRKWAVVCRNTHVVVAAVMKSIDLGCKLVYL